MLEAVKVALDPSPAQERAMLSHSGAARFAFNAGLAHVKEQLEARTAAKDAGVETEQLPSVDWNLYALRRWWNTERTFECEHCGRAIDRDLNAAYNLVGLVTPVAGSGPETSNGSGGNQKTAHAQHVRQAPKKLQPRTRNGSAVDRREAILAS
ncbi:helix-turn-helix domain-containing protein [Pseudarthrobacter sp. Y6]|uniref:helix-turn-helix domain-containing protein n=1 Tax=Pseudarthrobacter sp. Y6 TaxID=3418422 RepID=UPI003CF42145